MHSSKKEIEKVSQNVSLLAKQSVVRDADFGIAGRAKSKVLQVTSLAKRWLYTTELQQLWHANTFRDLLKVSLGFVRLRDLICAPCLQRFCGGSSSGAPSLRFGGENLIDEARFWIRCDRS